MNEKITIAWESEDGYCGGARPHSFQLDPDDFDGMDLKEIEEQVAEAVTGDFQDKVTWSCDTAAYAKQIHDAIKAKEDQA